MDFSTIAERSEPSANPPSESLDAEHGAICANDQHQAHPRLSGLVWYNACRRLGLTAVFVRGRTSP